MNIHFSALSYMRPMFLGVTGTTVPPTVDAENFLSEPCLTYRKGRRGEQIILTGREFMNTVYQIARFKSKDITALDVVEALDAPMGVIRPVMNAARDVGLLQGTARVLVDRNGGLYEPIFKLGEFQYQTAEEFLQNVQLSWTTGVVRKKPHTLTGYQLVETVAQLLGKQSTAGCHEVAQTLGISFGQAFTLLEEAIGFGFLDSRFGYCFHRGRKDMDLLLAQRGVQVLTGN